MTDMAFHEKMRAGRPVLGTWVKTPHPHVVEVLGLSGLDVLVLDAEHAPFGREALDQCLLAARAGGMPVLVRPSANDPAAILQALDGGADGVLVPHVRSVADAHAAVRASRYVPNGRGYAGSTRAAGYTTTGMARHRAAARETLVIAQVEDADALAEIGAIAAAPGLDAVFIGRADFAVSLEADSMDDPVVVDAVETIAAACRKAALPFGMFLARPGDAGQWTEKGASFFFLKSDQAFLLDGAERLAREIRS